jgi:hypothetical protein
MYVIWGVSKVLVKLHREIELIETNNKILINTGQNPTVSEMFGVVFAVSLGAPLNETVRGKNFLSNNSDFMKNKGT